MRRESIHLLAFVIILACAASPARAERDVEYVRMLREQRFWEVAEAEADRLLADPALPEDKRVGLILEKARIAKDMALVTFNAEKQTALIEKSRAILSDFVKKYSSRPEPRTRSPAEDAGPPIPRSLSGSEISRA